ncbi:excitatory amino acid transporter 1-like isoform X2 [Nelusetta ayraudi]|uniref:excitatory amino acid transporter 1-like isoform X2 n=1 Tax=Nelusetta ayraudi TaxID=303726 RepID=UPI003F6F0616
MVHQTVSQSTQNADDMTDTHGIKSSQEPLHLESSWQKKWDIKSFLKRNTFVLLTVGAIATGVGVGIALRSSSMTLTDKKYFTFPGELLLRMLQCLILPLITSSVITVVLIQPGRTPRVTAAPSSGERKPMPTVDAFLDLIRNMFPSNVVTACFEQYKTAYSKNATVEGIYLTQATESNNKAPIPGAISGVNILGLITLCIAFGLVLGRMEDDGKPLRDFFKCLNQATMHLISVAIWFTPVGIFFLVGGQILIINDVGGVGRQLVMYFVTVIVGLAIHSLVTIPIIYIVVTRKNPLRLFVGIVNALTTALGTSSSLVTLPVTIRCLEDNLNLDQRVTRVILPISSALTLEGTALYEAVAAIFIAQIYSVHLDAAEIVIISITATVAAIGGAGIPNGGMVTATLVLSSVGLPLEGITYVIAVDWILDRLRTVTNVISDSVGVAVVHHLCRSELEACGPIEQHLVEEDKESPSTRGSNCLSNDD